jgi:hypothetical protein
VSDGSDVVVPIDSASLERLGQHLSKLTATVLRDGVKTYDVI